MKECSYHQLVFETWKKRVGYWLRLGSPVVIHALVQVMRTRLRSIVRAMSRPHERTHLSIVSVSKQYISALPHLLTHILHIRFIGLALHPLLNVYVTFHGRDRLTFLQ